MTIQELINELEKIEDKSKTIGIYELIHGCDYDIIVNFKIVDGFKTDFGHETDYILIEK